MHEIAFAIGNLKIHWYGIFSALGFLSAMLALNLKRNVEAAVALGKLAAAKAIAAGISTVVFDRSGVKYHGKIKALADAAREAGLKF